MVEHGLKNALKVSMIISLFGSILILISGLCLYLFLPAIVERYIDGLFKDLNATKLIINAQESIVPTKDDMPQELDLGEWPQYIAVLVSTLGAGLILFSSFGIAASTNRKPDYLLILVVLMMAVLISKFLLLGSFVDLNSAIHSAVREKLVEELHNSYEVGARSNSTFTFMMNTVMLMAQCCGINGPADFLQMGIFNFTYDLDDDTYQFPVFFPLACCRKSYTDKGFQSAVACAKSMDISYINTRGCYEQMYTYISNNYGLTVILVFVFVILWEVLQILTGLLILFAPSKVEKDAADEVLRSALMENFSSDDDVQNAIEQELLNIKHRGSVFVPFTSETSLDSKPEETSQIW